MTKLFGDDWEVDNINRDEFGDPVNRICPECATGKHQNCNGEADIDMDDNMLPCECDDVSHRAS